MRFIKNQAGNRIVEATPEETRALRPCVAAAFRRWRARDVDIPDFCQQVELTTWIAVTEQRVPGEGFKRPVDALLDFMFAVSWNLWRNHSRLLWRHGEVLHDEVPDVASPSPDARLEARDALQRIAKHEDVALVLIGMLEGPRSEQRGNLPKSTFHTRSMQARKWARDVASGHWKEPPQPTPPTPWKRKGKR